MAIERRKPRDRAANYGKLPDTQERVEYLRDALRQAEGMVAKAEEARSWQAAVSAKRLALQTRDELDLALAKASAPDDTMSDEQLLGIIVQAVASMPAVRILLQVDDGTPLVSGAEWYHEVVASSPEQFGKIIKAEYARWAPVVKESGAKID